MRKTAEYIESLMDEKKISRVELAEMLGRSKGWVTQLLDGDRNRTIRTVADVLAVLDTEMEIGGKPFGVRAGHILAFSMDWHPEFSEWPKLSIVTEPQVA